MSVAKVYEFAMQDLDALRSQLSAAEQENKGLRELLSAMADARLNWENAYRYLSQGGGPLMLSLAGNVERAELAREAAMEKWAALAAKGADDADA